MRRCATVEALERRSLFAAAHFAVIGDFGNDSTAEANVATMVKSWNPDFIVTVGDNSYPTAETFSLIDTNIGKYYHDFTYRYAGAYGAGSPTRRFFPAPGNHDWGNVNPGSLAPYLSFFDLPGNERYYDFVQGPIHFFIIDSDTNESDGTTPTSVQGQWLKAKLAAATEPHKLVFFHHPGYSSGNAHGSDPRMRWSFAKWGATAVFTGHEHNYERLFEEGIPFFVDGVGGAELSGTKTPIAGSQVLYNANYGAMLVDADDAAMNFKFYDRTGALIDNHTLNLSATSDLIRAGADWKYFDQGTSPGAAWKTIGFTETGWSTGAAQLGYGDSDEATVVGYGPDPNAKCITTYFRKTFNIANPFAFTGLNLSMLRDDGAVVYLNGTEVWRNNMPAGAISNTTPAMSAIGGEDEGNWYSTTFGSNLLVAGANVIAVELHQFSGTSSDIGFDLSLQGSLDIIKPSVTSTNFLYDSNPMALRIGFSESVGASLGAADVVLTNLTTNQTVSAGSIAVAYDADTNLATITFPGLPNGALPDGNWRMTLAQSGVTDRADNPLATNGSFDFFILAGDANRDRIVDIRDLAVLGVNWQQSPRTFSQGDFNYDTTVDATDLGILSARWQGSLPTAGPAPADPLSVKPRTPSRTVRRLDDVLGGGA